MDSSFVKISWQQLEQDCLALMPALRAHQIDKIVAISRGGLVTARILSDLLSVPISHITISSYTNLQQEKEPLIDEMPTRNFDGETLLIVDEISDTGKTFERALSYFRNFNVKAIHTLALYVKPGTGHLPSFWAKELSGWVIFPYEVKETADGFVQKYGSVAAARAKLLEVGFEAWEIESVLQG